MRQAAILITAGSLLAAACTSSATSDETPSTTTVVTVAEATTADPSPTTSAATTSTTTSVPTTTTTTTSSTTTTTPTTTSTTVTVPAGNRAPEVTVTSPGHLSSFIATLDEASGLFGSAVTLTARAADPDGDPVTIEWHSSIEGFLGTGDSLTVTLHTIGSDASQPFITARALDQWGVLAEDSVQVIVWIPSDT